MNAIVLLQKMTVFKLLMTVAFVVICLSRANRSFVAAATRRSPAPKNAS
jgi:hypothetical protein